MRDRIIQLIEAEAARDPRVVFLTGDLGFSVVEPLAASLGERFINMGVAEANMISVASSLSARGFRPFVYSIVPFITLRCLEQIRNDIAYQKRPVRLIGVGAGYSYGSLGPSHHALDDANVMAAIPGMIVCNPGTVAELDRTYAAVAAETGPAYFRIAREPGGTGVAPILSTGASAYVARDGGDLTIVASGSSLGQAIDASTILAARGVTARVVSVPIPQPFPHAGLAPLLADGPVICLMEASRGNPLSVGVMEVLLESGRVHRFADMHAPHAFASVVGDTETLRAAAGLDAAAVAARAEGLLALPRAA